MADIPTLGPWIPGQQLYGSMIPRPEHEALLYKDEAERVRAHLLAFEKRVKAIMAGNGNNKEDRLRLRNLEMFDMSIPRTLGYEVVPFGEHRDGEEPLNEAKEDVSLGSSSIVPRRILPKLFLSKRLSVIPTDDDHPTIGLDSPDQIVLECNQYSTYEITLCKRSESKMEEEDGEEEGVEIVAMGRLSTLMDLGESGRAKETINGDGGLSLMYQSSDRIHVAFFRTQGHSHRGKKLASKRDSPNEAKCENTLKFSVETHLGHSTSRENIALTLSNRSRPNIGSGEALQNQLMMENICYPRVRGVFDRRMKSEFV